MPKRRGRECSALKPAGANRQYEAQQKDTKRTGNSSMCDYIVKNAAEARRKFAKSLEAGGGGGNLPSGSLPLKRNPADGVRAGALRGGDGLHAVCIAHVRQYAHLRHEKLETSAKDPPRTKKTPDQCALCPGGAPSKRLPWATEPATRHMPCPQTLASQSGAHLPQGTSTMHPAAHARARAGRNL